MESCFFHFLFLTHFSPLVHRVFPFFFLLFFLILRRFTKRRARATSAVRIDFFNINFWRFFGFFFVDLAAVRAIPVTPGNKIFLADSAFSRTPFSPRTSLTVHSSFLLILIILYRGAFRARKNEEEGVRRSWGTCKICGVLNFKGIWNRYLGMMSVLRWQGLLIF